MILERPPKIKLGSPLGWGVIDSESLTNGLVAAIFAATGPVAIILSVANAAQLDKAIVNSWIFAAFFIGGILTVILSFAYRQPIAIAWTMPGAALLISALDHMSFSEAVGAFLMAGLVMLCLGVTGIVGWLMSKFPTDVVMAMVAGVFLPFGLNLIIGIEMAPFVAGASVLAFLVPTIFTRMGRYLPPMLAALVAGIIVAIMMGEGPSISGDLVWIAKPVLIQPKFTISAMIELVIPLVISVIAVQNVQGVSVLQSAGYRAPINVLTVVCGYGSFLMGALGSVPTCLTGPANAILVSSGKKGSHFVGAIFFGLLFAIIGLFAPLLTAIAATMTPYFIMVIGGLAMLPVLSSAFQGAFRPQGQTRVKLVPSLVAFLITISDFSMLNIAAPFWGLIFGYIIHLLLVRKVT